MSAALRSRGPSWRRLITIRSGADWKKREQFVGAGFNKAPRRLFASGGNFWNARGRKFVSCCWMNRKKASGCGKAIRFVGFSRRRNDGRSTALIMKRSDLEHVIRAAGSIAGTRELIIVGSQAILGTVANPPPDLTVSQEADLYPANAPEKADLIDGSIGEKSPFHETFGYYAHGVSPETAVLPADWKSRLVRVENQNTNGIAGLCLSLVDLAVSKLAAGREKDLEFVRSLFQHKLLKPADVEAVFGELGAERLQQIKPRLAMCSR